MSFCTTPSSSALYLTWHHCLSHTSLRNLQDLRRRGEIDVNLDDSEAVMRCEDCVIGKFSRLKNRSRSKHKVSGTLDRVHSDLCSLPSKSYNNSRYFMLFIDEHSHYGVPYFLKSKSQAFSAFKHYVAYAEHETARKLKVIRSENGGEYTSQEWDNYCLQSGIVHSMGPPHSPQLNGIVERFNWTLLNKILPSLFHADLPVRFWEAGAQHAIRSYNFTPSCTNKGKACPMTLWKPSLISYSSLHAFGC